MANKRSAKSKISPQKRAIKYGRLLVVMVAADYICTQYKAYQSVMDFEGKAAYITNDRCIDTESFFNLIFCSVCKDSELKNMLNKLITHLVDFQDPDRSKTALMQAADLAKNIAGSMTPAQYCHFARSALMQTRFGFFLAPIFNIFDNEYWPNQFVWGYKDGKVTSTEVYPNSSSDPLSVPFFLLASVDNIEPFTPQMELMQKAGVEYLQAVGASKYALMDNQDKQFGRCALANYYTSCSCFNKFGFGYIHTLTNSDVQEFAVISRLYEKDHAEEAILLKELFLDMDNDIFTRRKFILRNAAFPDLEFGTFEQIVDEPQDDQNKPFKNIHVFEKEVGTENDSLFMIYLEYSFLSDKVRRTVPIVVDNLSATCHSLCIIDHYVMLFLLGLYGLLDELHGEILDNPLCKLILEPIKEITSQVVSVDIERKSAAGYHQSKEVRVEAFVRKLPAGQTASVQAKELAKKYHVNLGSDHTIVSPYIRNKGKQEKL